MVKCHVEGLNGEPLTWFFDLTERSRFTRIQGGPDLSPADVVGFDMLDVDPLTSRQRLRFNPGPFLMVKICTYFDELNRTPAKTQSCVLEPMAEKGNVTLVTMDKDWAHRRTYRLPVFYMVGSNNPDTQEGTFPLPEAGSDRFMVKIIMKFTGKLADLLERGEPDLEPNSDAGPELKERLKDPEFDHGLLQLRADFRGRTGPFRPGFTEYTKWLQRQEWARGMQVPPTVAELGGADAIVDRISQPAKDTSDLEYADKVEAMLTCHRHAELDELRRGVRETVTIPRRTAEFIADLVYNTWSEKSYREAVGGVAKGEEMPFRPRDSKRLDGYRAVIRQGASPRAAFALRDLSRSYAYFTRGPGSQVGPDDVAEVARYVLRHRVFLRYQAALGDVTTDDAVSGIIQFLVEDDRQAR